MLPKEVDTPVAELERLAEILAQTFIQGRDPYARQLSDGRYVCITKPLTPGLLQAHLRGSLTLGAYVLDRDSRARFVVLDADDEVQFARLLTMASELAEEDIPAYLELSRRGVHLWLFLANPVTGLAARQFGQGLIKTYGLEGIELFPKQDYLQGGPGSLIRLPFGIHRRDDQRYGFIQPDGQPLAETLAAQILALSAPRTVPKTVFEVYRQRSSISTQEPILHRSGSSEGALSKRIKDSIPVLDFVSQFVLLSPAGLGLCPFHDDLRPSFAVNLKENYWHCFAGCGGGSIIDFWMKWRGIEFVPAVRELAKMLL